MHRLFPRTLLEQCSNTLVNAVTTDEMRLLGQDLLDRLMRLYDDGRLGLDVLLLALDSLSLISELDGDLALLRAAVGESTSTPAALTERRPTSPP
jgi:hypothetical protein